MVSLDDIVLVSEADFASTYASDRHLLAAVDGLRKSGITFPIKYTSPFFPQLNWLAALVYFKGAVSVNSKVRAGFEYAPTYQANLFANAAEKEWINSRIAPYFCYMPEIFRIGVKYVDGSDSDKTHLNRPLARILVLLGIPTAAEDFISPNLPRFMTQLSEFALKSQEHSSRYYTHRLLLDVYEAFLSIKTTFTHDFYWEFFMPVKIDKEISSGYRRNMISFLQSIIPEVNFRELGKNGAEPRERRGGSQKAPLTYYDGFFCLPAEGIRILLSSYARVMDLEHLLNGRPQPLELVRASQG